MLEFEAMLKHIEDLFQLFYSFFSYIPKRHFEACRFYKSKGNNILRNVKTCWINMFNLANQVMSMHMPLIAKMVEDNPFLMAIHVNFELLCNVNLFISLFDLMSILETIHPLSKFAHKQDVFVCDYVVAINIC